MRSRSSTTPNTSTTCRTASSEQHSSFPPFFAHQRATAFGVDGQLRGFGRPQRRSKIAPRRRYGFVGSLEVNEGEYILEAAEAQGYDWPFSCRAGACANCAAIVYEGDIDMDMQQILSDEEVEDKNVRLTCIGTAETDEVKIVYNAKHLDYLQNRVI